MSKSFDRDQLLSAFDEIGQAASKNGAVLHMAVYGGSALMLASNFRFSSEDVDVAELPNPWPAWLTDAAARIAEDRNWSADWLNEAVGVHLSAAASQDDHIEFGTFPRSDADPGLIVYIPTLEYMLALKLKAVRVFDPLKGPQEADDIRNLLKATGLRSAEDAVEVLARYFPRTAADPIKQLFLLRHVLSDGEAADAPRYPV